MKDVSIAFVTNKRFWNYTYVAIYSLILQANPSRDYVIYIVSEEFTEKEKKQLRIIEQQKKNITFNVIDPSHLVKGYDFFTLGHFSKETYYRLVLQDLIPDIDKILYLDSDIIVKSDVAELFDTDVDGKLVGASSDPDTAGLYNGYMPRKKEYMDTVLKLKDPYSYFQAGVLLMNLAEFRKRYTTKQILDYSTSAEFQLLDQDILNHLCEGSIKYIDMAWNYMVDFAGIRKSQIIAKAPLHLIDMYDAAGKNPRIIHYAGPEKPWHYPEMDRAQDFWDVARQTAVYEPILWNMAQHAADEIDRWKHRPKKSLFERLRLLSLKVLPEDNPFRKALRNNIKKQLRKRKKNNHKQKRNADWIPEIPEIYAK